MHLHHRWAQATTALQVSIAVAAIALLTKRRWMEWATLAFGGVGIALGIVAGCTTEAGHGKTKAPMALNHQGFLTLGGRCRVRTCDPCRCEGSALPLS